MHVVTVMNPKGGVGKTTTVHQLSAALTLAHDLRVLVVDLASQAGLTRGWLGEAATCDLDPERSVAAILGGRSPSPSRVIRSTGLPGLSLIPGSKAIDECAGDEPEFPARRRNGRLREFLREVEEAFDVVMIDTQPGFPNRHACAALAASQWIVVPVYPDPHSSRGLIQVLELLNAARAEGYVTELLGCLLSRVSDRCPLHRLYGRALRSLYGDCVFGATVPERSEFCEPASAWRSTQQYRSNGKAAKAVKAVTNELISKILRGKAEGRHRTLPLIPVDLFEIQAALDERRLPLKQRPDSEAA